jgi:predicted alpha/beta hydrolase family esterase
MTRPHPTPPPVAVDPLSCSQVLLLPGWQDSGPTHWQSRWQALYGDRRVEQADWHWPRRGDWMARLDEVLADRPPAAGPVLLVAHSLGCHLVAAWAAHSRWAVDPAVVAAALLVAPPDVERASLPPQLAGWRQPVRQPLPLPAQLLYSSDDPWSAPERSLALAADWAVAATALGPRGHVNGDSGLGDWAEGRQMLRQLAIAAQERRITA